MRILITGATGFVGKRLGGFLAQKGHEIVVLSRNPAKAQAELAFPCRAFGWNPTKELPPSEAFEKVDAVVNLAGEPIAGKRWSDDEKQKILESRVLGTRNLVRAIEQSLAPKPKVFISASAIGFYGDRKNEVLSEVSEPGSGFLTQVCKEWEAEVPKSSANLRTAIVRFGMVLGHDGGALEKMLPVFRAGLGGALGDGLQWMSWIHIDDLTALIWHLIERQQSSGTFNAVSPNPTRNKEFTLTLSQVLKKRALLRVPAFVLRLSLGEMSEVLLASQRVLPTRTLESGFTFRFSELTQALVSECDVQGHV